jgi:hypothetical protein
MYLIEQERIPATKVGGRWYVDSEALDQDPATAQRLQAHQGRLREAIEEALTPTEGRKRYSVRDLKAWQISEPLYRQLCASPGSDHPATRHLHSFLAALTRGCHRFSGADKAAAYREARDAASLAVLDLWLADDPTLAAVATSLEQELMPALAGLLRRCERLREPRRP